MLSRLKSPGCTVVIPALDVDIILVESEAQALRRPDSTRKVPRIIQTNISERDISEVLRWKVHRDT